MLDHVLTRYIESLVYQATLENLASEHAARMVAMKSLRTTRPSDRFADADLQQGAPGGDHAGNFGNRRRRGGGMSIEFGGDRGIHPLREQRSLILTEENACENVHRFLRARRR